MRRASRRNAKGIQSERGATAIEYGLFAAGIGVTIAAAVFLLGVDVARLFGGIAPASGLGGDTRRPPLVTPLTNGSFDTPDAPSSWTIAAVEGWDNPATGGRLEIWADGFLGMPASEGNTFLELDAGRGGIDHVRTTVDMATGAPHTLRFDHAARPGGGARDDVEITHNGAVVATVSPRTIGAWETAEIELVGAEGDDVIGFRELAGQNSGSGVLLDNVRID